LELVSEAKAGDEQDCQDEPAIAQHLGALIAATSENGSSVVKVALMYELERVVTLFQRCPVGYGRVTRDTFVVAGDSRQDDPMSRARPQNPPAEAGAERKCSAGSETYRL